MTTGPAALARAVHSNPELVFVYGTLKRGQGNHHWLLDAPFLGEAILPGLVLHDLGPFPMAVPGEGSVRGEVYGVDAAGLARLDRLEGYPRLYDRRPMPLADGRRAWVYLGRPHQVRYSPVLQAGCWSGRRALELGIALLLLLAAGSRGALAGDDVATCQAWQQASGEQKLRLANALGSAHYLTRLHLEAAAGLTNPEAPAVALYATSDLRRLCNGR